MSSRPKAGMRVRRLSLSAIVLGLLLFSFTIAALITVLDRPHNGLCASSSQRSLVRSRLAGVPYASVSAVAEAIETPLAVALDAFPEERRAGVAGDQALTVWQTLRTWPQPMLDVTKPGAKFLFTGPLPEMYREPSGEMMVGKGAPFAAHLFGRVGAIYAVIEKTREGAKPIVLFLDSHGAEIFRVYPHFADVQARGVPPAEFNATFEKLRTLPPICARDGK